MSAAALRPTIFALSVIGTLAAASTAAAQGGVVIARSGAGARAIVHNALPIADESVAALIQKYEPGLLDDQSDANALTIVLDNANNYVKSVVRKATMFHATGDSLVVVGPAGVVMRRIDSDPRASSAAAVVTAFSRGAGEPANGFMNTGVDPSDIEAISTKRYEAGKFTHGDLIVTVLRLK